MAIITTKNKNDRSGTELLHELIQDQYKWDIRVCSSLQGFLFYQHHFFHN